MEPQQIIIGTKDKYKTFVQKVKNDTENGKKILIQFSADWCGPCKKIKEKIKNIKDVEFEYYLIDVDEEENHEACINAGVTSMPQLHVLDKVSLSGIQDMIWYDPFVGAQTFEKIKDRLLQS